MKIKQRLRKLREECWDWGLIVASFALRGMSKREAELALLELEHAGLVRIEPVPNGPNAIMLTLPEGIPDEAFAHGE